jgi:hypothetical protein
MRNTTTTTAQKVEVLAAQTEDAYSAGRYQSWSDCVRLLLEQGYDERQTEAILRSKHMRWAADMAGTDQATAEDLRSYMDRYPQYFTQAELDQLVDGTF